MVLRFGHVVRRNADNMESHGAMESMVTGSFNLMISGRQETRRKKHTMLAWPGVQTAGYPSQHRYPSSPCGVHGVHGFTILYYYIYPLQNEQRGKFRIDRYLTCFLVDNNLFNNAYSTKWKHIAAGFIQLATIKETSK